MGKWEIYGLVLGMNGGRAALCDCSCCGWTKQGAGVGSCVVLGLWAGAIAPLWPGWRPREGCGPAKVAWLLPEQFVRMWSTGQWGLRGTLV